MRPRAPCVAGIFYPASESALRDELRRLLAGARRPLDGEVRGGLVPHAGYAYSGRVAAAFFASVPAAPETVVFCASVHLPGVTTAALCARGAWSVPLGDVAVDEELAREILRAGSGVVEENEAAHRGDHAIEVQLPFVVERWPSARFVPMVVPADGRAIGLGSAIGAAARTAGRSVLAVASSDLTHYGARYGFAPYGAGPDALARAHGVNDAALLERVARLDGTGVLEE
ncbi:MAG: AmmeMemoRadiSam system protein B, partial [Planctomycetota bacterium]